MKTYFFIPGTKLKKLNDIQKLGIDQIIIDLEDAVKYSERELLVNEIKLHFNNLGDIYFRVPIYNPENNLDLSIFEELQQIGFTKFMLPKLQSSNDFKEFIDRTNNANLNLILLVETPRFFLELKDIVFNYKKHIAGLGLGSHDFMAEVGGEHNLKNIEYPRQQLLYIARSISVEAIDIACMEIRDEILISEEIKDGLNKGFDGKFFIHPNQIAVFRRLDIYSKEEYDWALKVIERLHDVGSEEEFNPIILDGEIVERPHLNKALKIKAFYETK